MLANLSIPNPPVPGNGNSSTFNIEKGKEDESANIGVLGDAPESLGTALMSMNELDKLRGKEITNKAIAAILLHLLKWLRVSRKWTYIRIIVCTTY
jgi:hypothetical protein